MATLRDELLQQINVKLDMLVKRYGELRKHQQMAEVLKEENALLKQQLETLKMAKTLAMGESDVHQAKVQLSRLVRQIDSCISLLMVDES